MSEELKPCPFCGVTGDNLRYDHLHKEGCIRWLLDRASRTETKCPGELLRKAWNTRPIEDALRAEIERLKIALIDEGRRWDETLAGLAAVRDQYILATSKINRLSAEPDACENGIA